MIQKKTYDDLRLLLDTLEGLPYESQKDIAYVDAVRLIVDKYEEETMRRKSPHELTKNNPVAKLLQSIKREKRFEKINKWLNRIPFVTVEVIE